MKKTFLKSDLTVEAVGRNLTAMVKVANVWHETIPVYLPHIILKNGPTKSLFEISTTNGKKIPFTAPSVKSSISKNDFYILKPGETLSFEVRLDKFYALPEEAARLKIRYIVFNPSTQTTELFKVESQEVEDQIPQLK
ncbi:MAG: hypothetical protein WCK43_07480 [bacterium]